MRVAVFVSLLGAAVRAFACEQGAVLAEHLEVDDAGSYYVVNVQRAHGDNLIATIVRSFGGAWLPGQTVTIQIAQLGLAAAVCPLDAREGETWLLKTRSAGGALQISPFDIHNLRADHERFATYVRDIEAAAARQVDPGLRRGDVPVPPGRRIDLCRSDVSIPAGQGIP